ncbi:MAG: YbaB/EbfC family nucleoid-associated protein [Candidatus Lambdaproteobacteria bacterium]|nr:YbaB/EbfC family nucleoid-associated protein [Candidatus Lambdaproteobacteria bacterium]
MASFTDMIRQAAQIGETLKQKQEELAQRRFEVASGGGMVRMTFNGKSEALACTIAPELLAAGDVRMVEDLVLSAVNEGIRQSQDAMKEELGKLAGGLKIPGVTA